MTDVNYVTEETCKAKHDETKRGISLNRWCIVFMSGLIAVFVGAVSWAAIIGHAVDSRQKAHESYHSARDKSIDEMLKEIKLSIKELVHEVRASNGDH